LDIRLRFLEQFLGALGAQRIEWSSIEPERVQGTVVYDEADPDERQDFHWAISEAEAPSDEVLSLASMIRTQGLLSIDKLIVDPGELRQRYSVYSGRIYSSEEFERVLEALESIEVPMLDDGAKGDAYFIHQ
jgi:hypothetical protein